MSHNPVREGELFIFIALLHLFLVVGPQEWRTWAHNGELARAILGMSGHCCMFSCRLSDSSYEWEVQDVSGPYTIEWRFVIAPHVRWLRLAVWWNGEGVQVGPDACTSYGRSNCMYLLGLMTVGHWSIGTLGSIRIEYTQNGPHIHSSFEQGTLKIQEYGRSWQ